MIPDTDTLERTTRISKTTVTDTRDKSIEPIRYSEHSMFKKRPSYRYMNRLERKQEKLTILRVSYKDKLMILRSSYEDILIILQTSHKDILMILQASCREKHQISPLSYKENLLFYDLVVKDKPTYDFRTKLLRQTQDLTCKISLSFMSTCCLNTLTK